MLGEELALAHLLAQGLKPLIRNYRCKMGELDLVMMERETLVLVEVRCRSNKDYGGAAASIDWKKQRRLVLAAEHLRMKRAELRRYPARFDVVAITTGASRKPKSTGSRTHSRCSRRPSRRDHHARDDR